MVYNSNANVEDLEYSKRGGGGRGAEAIIFKPTYLYVSTTAFMREFLLLYDESQKLVSIGKEENFLFCLK